MTISGKDNSGNSFQIDLILNKDVMGMHQMMMQHMSMMGGMMNSSFMGHMGGMRHTTGMMNPNSMSNMGGMNMGGMMNNTMMQSCPCMQMMKLMQNQYLVEGGLVTMGTTTYPVDSGNARIVDDKVFLNAHAGAFKAGKIVLYGKLNQNGAIKGFLLLPEVKNYVKISGSGNLADAIP